MAKKHFPGLAAVARHLLRLAEKTKGEPITDQFTLTEIEWKNASPEAKRGLVRKATADLPAALNDIYPPDPFYSIPVWSLLFSSLVRRGHSGEAARIAIAGMYIDPHAKPLTPDQRDVFNLVCAEGPLQGHAICNRTGISQSSLTTHIIPALKKHGIQSSGDGYFYPPIQRNPPP